MSKKDFLESIDKRIRVLFLELYYVQLEWKLMKEIDETISNKDENHIEEFKTMVFSVKDSLWYSIVMRLAKILDERDKKSIFGVLNSAIKNKERIKFKNLNQKEIDYIIAKLCSMKKDINEEGKSIDIFKEIRDNYFAHLDRIVSPFDAQEKAFLGKKRIDNIIEECSSTIKKLCNEFDIDIITNHDIEKLKIDYTCLYNIIEEHYNG